MVPGPAAFSGCCVSFSVAAYLGTSILFLWLEETEKCPFSSQHFETELSGDAESTGMSFILG